MAKPTFEKELEKRTQLQNQKIKTSFALIRQEIDEMTRTMEAMKIFLKKQEKQYNSNKKTEDKLREEFRKDVDEFNEKISTLKLALDAVRELRKELVVKKDLAQIEDGIKISFRNEIEGYKETTKAQTSYIKELEKRITAIENGYVHEKKKAWFFQKKKEE